MPTHYLFLYSCVLCNVHQFLFITCVRVVLYTRQLTVKNFVLIIFFRHKNKKKHERKNILHALKYNEKPVLCFLKKIN